MAWLRAWLMTPESYVSWLMDGLPLLRGAVSAFARAPLHVGPTGRVAKCEKDMFDEEAGLSWAELG